MRIAYVCSRFPFPTEKGDKLRAFHQIKELSKEHEVYLIALSHSRVNQKNIDAMKQYCKEVTVFQISSFWLPIQVLISWIEGMPLQVAYFFDRTIKRKIQYHIIGLQPDHIVCQLVRAAPYVRSLPFPKTLDYMDVFSEGMKQRARLHPWLGWLFKLESERLAQYEKSVYRDFNNHTIISEQDKQRLRLASTEKMIVLPNGVDESFFHFEPHRQPQYDLVFIGNMGYAPNIEAAEWLVHKIMPAIWKWNPGISLLIAGARPALRVRTLATQDKRIEVRGWVDDIREAYCDGRIFVAPMNSGTGLQNKILEAMALNIPCITTQMVNNAIGANPDDEILLAESTADFVEKIITLLGDEMLRRRIAEKGRKFVETNYRWRHQNEILENLIQNTKVFNRV